MQYLKLDIDGERAWHTKIASRRKKGVFETEIMVLLQLLFMLMMREEQRRKNTHKKIIFIYQVGFGIGASSLPIVAMHLILVFNVVEFCFFFVSFSSLCMYTFFVAIYCSASRFVSFRSIDYYYPIPEAFSLFVCESENIGFETENRSADRANNKIVKQCICMQYKQKEHFYSTNKNIVWLRYILRSTYITTT